jgi:DNA-binding beta-propeller fold protein YncE
MPSDLAVSPDGSRLYVADKKSSAVIAYNAATGARLTRSWKLSSTPSTLSVTSDDVILASCADNQLRKCYQDGTVKSVVLSSQLTAVNQVVQLSGGQLAALVRAKFARGQAVCVSNNAGVFASAADCYLASIGAPVYLTALPNNYLLVADQAAGGSVRIYGPQLKSGLALAIPDAGRVLAGVRRVAVNVRAGLAVVAFNNHVMVFRLTC